MPALPLLTTLCFAWPLRLHLQPLDQKSGMVQHASMSFAHHPLFCLLPPHLLTAAGPEERHGEHPRRRRPGAGGRAGPVLAGAAGAEFLLANVLDNCCGCRRLAAFSSASKPHLLCFKPPTNLPLPPSFLPHLFSEQEQLEEMRADASLYDKMAASIAPNVSTVSLLWCLCCVPIKVLCWCTSCLPCWPAALLTCRSLH